MAEEQPDTSYELAPQAPGTARTRAEAKQPTVAEPVVERKCPHCGFRIVGKTTRNRCPDCAAPLDLTAANLLQFSATGWVRTIAVGSLLLAAAVFGQIAAIVTSWARQPAGPKLHALAPAAALIAAWLVTLREPEAAGEQLPWRWMVRVLSVVVAGAWGVLAFVKLPGWAAHPALYATLVLSGGQAVSLGLYYNAVAIRVPSDSLAWQAFNLSWVIGVECVFIIVLHFVRVADVEHLQYFFCAYPMIAGMGALLVWAAGLLVMFGVQLWAVARAGDDIAYRKAQRAIKQAEVEAARKGVVEGRGGERREQERERGGGAMEME
ncbi:MAG TPA: hypothetical protein VH253_04060 [Phycisphaerae bacterium]|nr:hypothetical protein [Phycisphaerae bacterium]